MKKVLIILTIGLSIISCKKELDHPPVTEIAENGIMSMDTLINMYQGQDIKFDTNYYVYATVTMDEVDGNIYKQVYIQQGDKAINVRMLQSGFLFVGDSIRINLKGTTLSKYAGVIQLDSVDFTKNVAVQATGKYVQPKLVTIADLDTSFLNVLATEPSNPNVQYKYLSQLVKLENVQFSSADIAPGSTYADGPNQQSKNLMLEDCDGNSIIVRNSGYANFANELVAQGNGTLVAIVSRYNSDLQLLIRSFNEIDMTGDRCFGSVLKNFDDGSVTSGGWVQHSIIGANVLWKTSSAGGAASDYCQISNYINGTKYNSENWLVSPSMDLSTLGNPYLNFNNAFNYTGPTLQVLVSTDYDGTSDPNTATWTTLAPILSSGSWAWANSGNVDLTPYKASNVHVAFKYTGTNTSGSTWELDDIKISG